MLTQEQVRAVFNYNSELGLLLRKQCWVCGCSNAPVFSLHGEGYLTVSVGSKSHLMHRLIWIYHHGDIPNNKELDHIDGNRANNRLENLRLVDRSRNNKNARRRVDNTSGYPGVFFVKSRKRWVVLIYINKQRKQMGSFKELTDAINARKMAQAAYGYHANHGRDGTITTAR
jgi:hypothetical protein